MKEIVLLTSQMTSDSEEDSENNAISAEQEYHDDVKQAVRVVVPVGVSNLKSFQVSLNIVHHLVSDVVATLLNL